MMATGGTEGKGSSGAKFRPPPAAVWNNMIDAGRAWADSQLDSPGGPPTRSRPTDIIKIKNTSGDARRTGEVLKIEGKALDTITAEHIWLMGVEPTADCYFGILKKPVADDGIEQLQVSGCCMALVDIQDVDHRRADIVAGEYVLQSSDSGPIEILYAPESTGEQTCVVRFGVQLRLQAILQEDLYAAVNTKRDPSTAKCKILRRKANGDLKLTDEEKTIVNRFKNISMDAGSYIKIEWIDGEWQPYAADCPGDSSSSGSV